MKPREQIEKIEAYSPGTPVEEVQRQLGLTKVVKLASNENPFGYSPLAEQAMIEEVQKINMYPEVALPLLAGSLAEKLGVSREQLFFGNGSDEIIRLLTTTYINQSDEAVMADVTFPRYYTDVLIGGGTPITVPLVEGVHDLEGMLAAVRAKTKMVFVCNPNNPTGTVVGKEQLLHFIERIPSHVLIVIDEAYYEYVHSTDYLETVPLLDKYPNLIVLRTFSKIYGLAGLRVGYGLMNPELVQNLMRVKEPFNVNRMAQRAALASLNDDKFVAMTRERNEQGKRIYERTFSELGLPYFSSQANFVMVDVKRPAKIVYMDLLKRGVIVRPVGYPTTIRVTIGNEEEVETFVQALKML
ncbi:histidinol-phosphate transaminase [Alicyclobacillus sp. SO9]|nr:histidinol-phosphate transaminase [Alicyclobacillus sp. SO9]